MVQNPASSIAIRKANGLGACWEATYEILARLQILKRYSNAKTAIKILYPRKLRRRLFKLADRKGWKVLRQEGSGRRLWERD